MQGSQLFGQQPTFRGEDFGIPEVAYFGQVQFRAGVATDDTWDEHDGMEFIFIRGGESCWEHGENRLLRASGGTGVIFPPHYRHRILNGVYAPSQMVWIVFQPEAVAIEVGRLIPPEEIAAIYSLGAYRRAPVKLSTVVMRGLSSLCALLANDALIVGSRMLKADVRAKFYSVVVEFWKVAALEHHGKSVNPIIKQAETALQGDDDKERIDEIADRLGCARSHLYHLFKQEVGMAPNDYRQRLRIRESCDHLARTEDHITEIAMRMGYSTSQYFSRVFKKYVGLTPKDYRRLFAQR
jgi:AraC-like DNA-binding protein